METRLERRVSELERQLRDLERRFNWEKKQKEAVCKECGKRIKKGA